MLMCDSDPAHIFKLLPMRASFRPMGSMLLSCHFLVGKQPGGVTCALAVGLQVEEVPALSGDIKEELHMPVLVYLKETLPLPYHPTL
jgi:hypothetical protein